MGKSKLADSKLLDMKGMEAILVIIHARDMLRLEKIELIKETTQKEIFEEIII